MIVLGGIVIHSFCILYIYETNWVDNNVFVRWSDFVHSPHTLENWSAMGQDLILLQTKVKPMAELCLSMKLMSLIIIRLLK